MLLEIDHLGGSNRITNRGQPWLSKETDINLSIASRP